MQNHYVKSHLLTWVWTLDLWGGKEIRNKSRLILYFLYYFVSFFKFSSNFIFILFSLTHSQNSYFSFFLHFLTVKSRIWRNIKIKKKKIMKSKVEKYIISKKAQYKNESRKDNNIYLSIYFRFSFSRFSFYSIFTFLSCF